MNKLLLYSIIFLSSLSLCSQPQPLHIGDTLPHHLLASINDASSSPSGGPQGARLIILDFFATSCASCIASLPKLQALQQQFSDRLQIILVTAEQNEKIEALRKKNKLFAACRLPIVTNDTIFRQLFPHQYVPHLAWINKGEVTAITGSVYAGAASIAAILSGKKINWPVKRDDAEFDHAQPLFTINANNIQEWNMPAVTGHAALTGYIPGVAGKAGEVTGSINNLRRIYFINLSIVQLYIHALGLPRDFPVTRIIIQSTDTARLVHDPAKENKDQWRRNNYYSYEVSFPVTMNAEQRRKKISSDLDFYLGMEVTMETRRLSCYVLKENNSNAKRSAAAAIPQPISLKGMTGRMNSHWFNKPVLDETINSDLVYIAYIKDLKDIGKLKEEAAQQGFIITEEEREVEVMIIRDKDQGNKAQRQQEN